MDSKYSFISTSVFKVVSLVWLIKYAHNIDLKREAPKGRGRKTAAFRRLE